MQTGRTGAQSRGAAEVPDEAAQPVEGRAGGDRSAQAAARRNDVREGT